MHMTDIKQKKERFQRLTRPWRDRLLGAALRRADSGSEAEDWVQETLLRGWRYFDSLNDDIAIYAWLLKILNHVIADNLRREIRRNHLAPVVLTEDSMLLEHSSSARGPFEEMVKEQTAEQMLLAIKSLPEDFSSVMLLRDIEGLSYKDVSQVLDIPKGTVTSRLSRGRRLLAIILMKEDCKDNRAKLQR